MYRVLKDWLLTPWRLAVHEPTATAVVADVHLGYREARRQGGEAVPLTCLADELRPIERARTKVPLRRLAVAGDLFEQRVEHTLLDQFLALLTAWNIEFAGLVPGNHDRNWQAYATHIPVHPEGMALADWHIVHDGSEKRGGAFVFGHWHPALVIEGRRVPCYLVGPRRLVLPAFSQEAVGQNVLGQRRWRGMRGFGICQKRVIDYGAVPSSDTDYPRRPWGRRGALPASGPRKR